MSITLNKFSFSLREKEVLTPYVNKVITTLNTIKAESPRHEATQQFANEVLSELGPLTEYVKSKSDEVVTIPDRAIYWLLEPLDQQIHSLNNIMPNTALLDSARAQFKGSGEAVLWELLQVHFKLSVHVIKRINGLDGLRK